MSSYFGYSDIIFMANLFTICFILFTYRERIDMGWATGSRLLSDIINDIKSVVDDDFVRQDIYEVLINNFENYDCDTIDECLDYDFAFDSAYHKLYQISR
jgi:hypothetical protein